MKIPPYYYNEETLQTHVINYLKDNYPKVRYCASLGGQYIPKWQKRTLAKKGRSGYVAGFPDIQITEARGGYHGLFIELKYTKRDYPSHEQKKWLEDLEQRGYKAVCNKGYEQTIETINEYLQQDETKSTT
jgi:hypothetical protein